ncbi:hypothetical protein [Salininema proteolyticum]|uniref:Uncharacterized protein n=1 Tax=Salininema proteolyticum TaxID=1607685 RepID=A0ABV8TXY7_9ACTN
MAFVDFSARSFEVRTVEADRARVKVIEPGGVEGLIGFLAWDDLGVGAIDWADSTVRWSLFPTGSRLAGALEFKLRAYASAALFGTKLPAEHRDGCSSFEAPAP